MPKRTNRRKKRRTNSPLSRAIAPGAIARRLRKHWYIALILLVAIATYNRFFTSGSAASATTPRPAHVQGNYDGIDVSKYQGTINWSKVAQDPHIQFVYIKASEGAGNVDARYKQNIKAARQAGLKVGSYHYFIGRKPAKDQFRNFNRYVSRSQQDLIPMVDVEEAGNSQISKAELRRNLQEFMDLVKDEYGVYPLLYSQYRFYNDRLAPEFNRYYLLIARYSSSRPKLKGSGNYNIWQYSEKGTIPGIRGHVDLDRFDNGSSLKDILLK